MKVKEAAERLEVSATTVYALVSSGDLGHYRVGLGRGQIRFAQEHIDAYLKRAEQGPKVVVAAPARPKLVKSRHFDYG